MITVRYQNYIGHFPSFESLLSVNNLYKLLHYNEPTNQEYKDKSNVLKITCLNKNLEQLPYKFEYEFTNLIVLNCAMNNIKQITNDISIQFESLQVLDLSNNKLTILPYLLMPNLQYLNISFNQITELRNVIYLPNLIELNMSNNKIKFLPKFKLPKLEKLDCSYNEIKYFFDLIFISLIEFIFTENKIELFPPNENIELPELKILCCNRNKIKEIFNISLPQLQYLDCSQNKICGIDLVAPNLRVLNCSENKIRYLPDFTHFTMIEQFNCYNNKISYIPNNITLRNLKMFICNKNRITEIPNNLNFPNIKFFDCSMNKITHLPLCIMNWRNIESIYYINNPIQLSPQIARFIKRVNERTYLRLHIYSDNQNIHNSNIQSSVATSINNITTRTDLPNFDSNKLIQFLLQNQSVNCKDLLIQYCNDKTEHSTLLLTFSEVLWYVIQTIEHDFDTQTKKEIYYIMNQEMIDSDGMCFTGKMSRIINCLNGFSNLVNIQIKDSEQISNIILLVKDTFADYEYSVEKHMIEVKKELIERGYTEQECESIIQQWFIHIE